MTMYYFIRSVPLLVGVEANNQHEAWEAAGRRVDDFMSDANESVERISHEDDSPYQLDYQGDAIYATQIPSP
jgi:hypothetical protein